MSSITTVSSYEEACERHRWEVPPRYNIASDVCDRHAREKLAMVHEDPDGRVQEVMWGQLQDDAARFANVLSALGVEPGDRVAMLLPPTPLTAAAFFGAWKTGAILLSMSVLYGDEGIRHRLTDSQAKVLVTNEANADRIERSLVEHLLILDQALLERGSTTFTQRPMTRRSSTTPQGPRDLPRESSMPTAICSPTRNSPIATTCATARFSTEWASGRGPRGSARYSDPGATVRFRPCCNARGASTRTGSSISSLATGSRTYLRPQRQSAR
jgi:acyl-CoA synthetase (AMP-forming)/AMP-acid ligase II